MLFGAKKTVFSKLAIPGVVDFAEKNTSYGR